MPFDSKQIEYLKSDNCILVDETDAVLGSATKMKCHLKKNIDNGMLHRAFSLFLFDCNNNLLLQQRSLEKITYPLHFTNTCCSHPLFVDEELDNRNNIGIKRAAVRKLHHELGINIDINDVIYITRILYKADNFIPKIMRDNSEDYGHYYDFGENELDYILVAKLKLDKSELSMNINRNEVASIKWVLSSEIDDFVNNCKVDDVPISPWFNLIYCNGFLRRIWDNIDKLQMITNDDITNFQFNF